MAISHTTPWPPLHVRLLKEICMQNNKPEIFQTAFISDGLRHKKRGNPEGLPEIPQIRDLRFTNNTGSRLSLSARLNSMQTKAVGFRRPCNHKAEAYRPSETVWG